MKKVGRKRKGFTLAEVLITLGIIGVVAALTIPTLMANYQKTQYVAALKKAYAEVTEALRLMANDAGCPDNLGCADAFHGSGNTAIDTPVVGNAFKKYFKLAKDCGAQYVQSDPSTKCLADSYSPDINDPASGQNMNDDQSGSYNFITADGFAISLRSPGICGNQHFSDNANRNLDQECGQIMIDTNNFKGPNRYGRDIFIFYIANGKGPAIYPMGGSEWLQSDSTWNSWVDSSEIAQGCDASQTNGWTCAGRVIGQGWQMKY